MLWISPLYVVCDEDVCAKAGWTLPDFTSACLEGGARLFQLRAKQASGRALLDAALELGKRVHAADGRLIVNDRADIARLSRADGVHVGQDDLPTAAIRALVGADAIVGLSTHTVSQLETAIAEPVSYIAVGPVFDTATKRTGYD